MFRTPHIVVAVFIILLGGGLPGLVAPRVQSSVALDELAAVLKTVPLTVGDWQGEEVQTSEAVVRAADCAGMIQRNYTNTRDGRQVSLLLLVGKPGPLSVHMPEVCYRGAGYRSQRDVTKAELDIASRTAEFRVLDMANSTGAVARYLRIYHSWNNGTGWTTPAVPRVAFARSVFLFKLYVTTPTTSAADLDDQDVCRDFIVSCLPAIDGVLLVPGSD